MKLTFAEIVALARDGAKQPTPLVVQGTKATGGAIVRRNGRITLVPNA